MQIKRADFFIFCSYFYIVCPALFVLFTTVLMCDDGTTCHNIYNYARKMDFHIFRKHLLLLSLASKYLLTCRSKSKQPLSNSGYSPGWMNYFSVAAYWASFIFKQPFSLCTIHFYSSLSSFISSSLNGGTAAEHNETEHAVKQGLSLPAVKKVVDREAEKHDSKILEALSDI